MSWARCCIECDGRFHDHGCLKGILEVLLPLEEGWTKNEVEVGNKPITDPSNEALANSKPDMSNSPVKQTIILPIGEPSRWLRLAT